MKLRKLWLVAALVLLVTACNEEPSGPAGADPADGPTALSKGKSDIDVRDRYVVVFKDNVEDVDAATAQLMRGKGGTVHYRYRHAIKGFAATIPPQAVDGIRRNPNVELIEPDGLVYKNATQNNPPSWGLDRIDQRNLPLDNSYTYQNDGEGVTVYIIDSGIRFDHQEFNQNRATSGYDFVDNDNYAYDCDGHGTHVAGTVGGGTVGVAKNVSLVAVRVLNCSGSGTWSGVIAGVDWVTANANLPAVANMSLGGGYYGPMNTAVENSISAGVVYAVSAGNSNYYACNYSPASAPNAITVGSTTSSDVRSSFSNYGTCVDVFAPGSSIYSSTMNTTSSYASWSGTSMASPHVAGVAALYLATPGNGNATPAQVTSAIINGATSGKVSNAGTGSPNLLLYSLIAGSVSTNPPASPSQLTATAATGAAEIDLSWTDNSSDESGFSIERWNGNSYVQIATVGSNVTTFTNTGLAYNSQYSYRVAAFNSAGNSGYSNIASATTVQLTAPAAPSGLQTTSVSSTSVALSWTDNATNEDNYEVRRSTDGGVSWTTLTASLAANSTTYSDNSVSAGNTYHFQVFATNAGGSTGSNTISVSTPAASNDMTIASIGTNAVSNKNTWQAQFTVTIVDGSNTPVSGANVTGAFSDGYSGSATVTTDGNGQCTFNSPFIHKKNSNVTLTVTNVTHGTLSWDQVQKSASVGKP